MALVPSGPERMCIWSAICCTTQRPWPGKACHELLIVRPDVPFASVASLSS